ncbi:hypothetical protein FE392_07780 [Xenorhabdus sp. 12]|uniref:Lipoprotein n=1 Tax=Xenorhabdus santafensis TaxID=2582833 RepID=A0ABU4S8Y7_9GAMM|nr:hypothetical protein [Xenorhabdus sp. 12]MDX7987230.1 hypothetical protein [Xenorhabdus sp. 12]
MALVALILTGCDAGHSKYNGIYTCKIGRLLNYIAVDRGSEYYFPLGTAKAKMTFNNGVMIIHGMKSGDYVGHEMTLTASPVAPDGRKLMSAQMFKYDDGELSESFSPHDGMATITIGNLDNGRIMQLLTNCKKNETGSSES